MITRIKTSLPPQVRLRLHPLAVTAHNMRYFGLAVQCPICSGHFRRFLPYGVGKIARQYAYCPTCGSVERHRLLWLYFQHRTNLFRDSLSVLHFAPEPTFEKRFKSLPNLDYITTDLYLPSVMVTADITDLPFPDQRFDVILCSHVLEHVPDDRKAMRELYRVLKPGGWAILLVPVEMNRATTFEDPSVTDPQERFRLFNQVDHVRIYGRDYIDRLEEAGFTVRQERYIHELAPTTVKRYGLEAHTIDNTLFIGVRH